MARTIKGESKKDLEKRSAKEMAGKLFDENKDLVNGVIHKFGLIQKGETITLNPEEFECLVNVAMLVTHWIESGSTEEEFAREMVRLGQD